MYSFATLERLHQVKHPVMGAMGLLLLPFASASSRESIEGIETLTQASQTEVRIHLTGPARYKSTRLTGAEHIYIDLPGVTSHPAEQPGPAGDPFVQRIRTRFARPDSTRITVNLKQRADCSITLVADPPVLKLVLTPASVSEHRTGQQAAQPHAEIPSRPALTIQRAARPPKIRDFLDGVLDAGARVADFRQYDPGDGVPVSEETSAYLSYDDRNLYIVFVCKDDPAKVRAHASKREDLGNDDEVFVYLDTFRDRQHAYVFAVNPLGVQADGLSTEGQDDIDYSFDTLWYSEGRLTADGYVVWISIPFKSLRFSSQSIQTWGIALQRSIVRKGEKAFWPYVTRQQAGFLQQIGELNGLENISPGRNIQLIPYGTYTNARTLDSTQPRLDTLNDVRVGMDIKAAVRNGLTLDATVNPDFSQVESDDPQVTINQRYEVVFPEKRPFFLENASYFQTPIELFFSRRIIDPQFGVRLTGKLGPWAMGFLASDDRAPGQQFGEAEPLLGGRSFDSIFSLHREFANQSTAGVMATTYNFGSSSNEVLSADTRLRLGQTWFFTGQAVKDMSRQTGGQRTQGQAYYAALKRSGRHFSYEGTYSDFSPDFSAPLGYIQRVDIRRVAQYASYVWRPENSTILRFGPYISGSIDWDHHGLLQDWSGSAGFSMDFKGPSGFDVSHTQTFERYLGIPFRYEKNNVSFYASWRRSLDIFGGINEGVGVNYDPPAGMRPFLGHVANDYFGLTWRPAPRVRLYEIYYYDRLAPPTLPVVYTNHLFETKLNYQFTRALSLRAIVSYYATLPNTGFIDQTRTKQLTGDFLLTYLINPGTALYVGYNNQHQNLAVDPQMPGNLIRMGPPEFLTNSQIFIKVSYLLRF